MTPVPNKCAYYCLAGDFQSSLWDEGEGMGEHTTAVGQANAHLNDNPAMLHKVLVVFLRV